MWGPYPDYHDIAKLEYGRLLWRTRAGQRRLVNHWTQAAHPHHERFQEQRSLIQETLESGLSDEELDRDLRERNTSLRAVARDIPSVFGSLAGTEANAET